MPAFLLTLIQYFQDQAMTGLSGHVPQSGKCMWIDILHNVSLQK